jgi:Zn finger protein HypA/HybF involved in hydrogenase expression
MKILKHDIDANEWKHTLKCYCCKTELEVVMGDVRYSGEAGDWHDSGWEKYEVTCPECSTNLTIDADLIHNLVEIKIQKRSRGFFR